MTLSPCDWEFEGTLSDCVHSTVCVCDCDCGCTSGAHDGDGVLVTTDDENTRHIVLCDSGRRTRVHGCATSLLWVPSIPCMGHMYRDYVSGVHLYADGGGVVVCRRRHGWWIFGRYLDRVCCSCCGLSECIHVSGPERWLVLKRNGTLSSVLPSRRSGGLDAFVERYRADGDLGSIWQLDADALRSRLGRLIGSENI